jgi:glycosyltransferase involved in cell wall biosynthesis
MMPSRIAYVVNVFPKLSETFIAGELAELLRRGVSLRVLSLRQPVESLRHDFIARAGLDKTTCYDAAKFPALLRDFKPQMLHAHFATEPTAAVRELAQESGVPFTFTAHGYDIRRKPPPDFAARAAAALAVVTVSEANARYIVKTFGVPPEHIRVIPCGVDTDQFRPVDSNDTAGRRSPGMEEVPWIVCVARHVRVKNLGLLLETCALLQDRGTRFRCAMIGDGPLRGELEEQRSRLGLERIVELGGAREQAQVLEWWRRASVAVLTSENEGMPVCLMEAAACGVPTVATAVGGVPELVEDGVTGFLVPPGDTPALATALQKLMQDDSLAARMGTSARRRAEARFSVRRQVDRLLFLWSSLLEAKPVQSATSGKA